MRKIVLERKQILYNMFLCFLFISLVFSPSIIVSVQAGGSGSYPPPATGDWVISENTWVSDETIHLNGSLIINDSYKLTLDNVTIYFSNMSANGDHGVTIGFGSTLNMTDSKILNETQYHHWFNSGHGKLYADNCEFSGAGCYLDYGKRGIKIAGSGASGSYIKNSKIYNSGWYGVVLDSMSNTLISNSSIYTINHTGLFIVSSSTITINYMTINDIGSHGIRVENSQNCVLDHNNISNVGYAGISLEVADNNIISHSNVSFSDQGFQIIRSKNNLIEYSIVHNITKGGAWCGGFWVTGLPVEGMSSDNNTVRSSIAYFSDFDGFCSGNNATRTTFKDCVAHHNKFGFGLGADINDTILQNCVAYDNWWCGFGVWENGTNLQWINCTSYNNGYAWLCAKGAGEWSIKDTIIVKDSRFYGSTTYSDVEFTESDSPNAYMTLTNCQFVNTYFNSIKMPQSNFNGFMLATYNSSQWNGKIVLNYSDYSDTEILDYWSVGLNVLTFKVSKVSGFSEVLIYVGGRGKPHRVSGATSWNYDPTTKTVTINVKHSSSVKITVNWVPASLVTLIKQNYYLVFGLISLGPIVLVAALIASIFKGKELDLTQLLAVMPLIIMLIIGFIVIIYVMNSIIGM